MKLFAKEYPHFPYLEISTNDISNGDFWQVALAKLPDSSFWQVPLAKIEKGNETILRIPLNQITWYHHISLLSKVKSPEERAFYIMETAQQGWSRDVMLANIDSGYYYSKGSIVNNFSTSLPPIHSDFARYAFKDPYTFGFIGTYPLKNELEIEKKLTENITDFLMEMGRGFAFVGKQYHIVVDGDDYYIDLLMYHLKLHRYIVIELKAVEFIPEFVSKLNFYVSAVDEYIKTPQDNPTIGLLLCPTKSNEKVRFALKGISQPLGVAEYEIKRLIEDIELSLPDTTEEDDI